MYRFEIDLRSGPEAERFNTAVYRFLELHAEGADGMDLVKIETCPFGMTEHKTLTLWSAQSLEAFHAYWRRARLAA